MYSRNNCREAIARATEEERLCSVKALAAELTKRGLAPADYLSTADLKASKGSEIDFVHRLRAEIAADDLLKPQILPCAATNANHSILVA